MHSLMLRFALATALALAWGLCPGPAAARAWQAPQEARGEIRGRIYGRQGGAVAPLANAILDLSLGGRHVTLTADREGGYRAAGLDPGRWRLRALHVGYDEMAVEVQVPAGASVSLDVELRWKPIPLPPITVRGRSLASLRPSSPAPPGEVGEVALRALEGTTGMVEGGLAQVAGALPGSDPAEPSDVLLMRGSAADLKLVLLDGAPIYTPFHMAGLVESFEPQALGQASLFLGGAPARFDGGLSYILDLRARSPRRDRVQGSAGADLLTGRALVEGPLTSSAGFLVGGRSIHGLGAPLLGQGDSPYGYGDLLARLEWEGAGGLGAFLTGFWNREEVRLDLPSMDKAAMSLDAGAEGERLLAMAGEDRASWGNRALSAGLSGEWGETLLELRLAASRYQAGLPVGDTLPLFARGRSDRVRATADLSTPWGEGEIHLGGSVDRMVAAYSALVLDTVQGAAAGRITPTRLDQDGVTGGVYLDARQPLGSSVRLRGGIRVDRFSGDRGVRVAPRLALSWLLTDQAMLTLAAGRYHQFSTLQPEELEGGLVPGQAVGGGGGSRTPSLAVASANHLVVSLDQLLTPGLRLGLEAFVKDFQGISGTRESLKASGVDLRVARDGVRASGWVGYTLTWFWASDGILASGSSPFSGRHLLSAGLAARLTQRTGLRLRAGYGDGLPYTSVPVGSDEPGQPAQTSELAVKGDRILNEAPGLVTGPDQGFLRVEGEIFGVWSPTWGGRRMELRPYLRVLNALNRRDALFYHFAPWRPGGPEPLAEMPVLPLLGLEWRF